MHHEPRGTIRADVEHSLNLERAHAFLGRAKHVPCDQPLAKRDFRFFENGAYRYGELFLAGVALEKTDPVGFAVKACDPFSLPAMGANRPIRPAHRLQIFSGRDVSREVAHNLV